MDIFQKNFDKDTFDKISDVVKQNSLIIKKGSCGYVLIVDRYIEDKFDYRYCRFFKDKCKLLKSYMSNVYYMYINRYEDDFIDTNFNIFDIWIDVSRDIEDIKDIVFINSDNFIFIPNYNKNGTYYDNEKEEFENRCYKIYTKFDIAREENYKYDEINENFFITKVLPLFVKWSYEHHFHNYESNEIVNRCINFLKKNTLVLL